MLEKGIAQYIEMPCKRDSSEWYLKEHNTEMLPIINLVSFYIHVRYSSPFLDY
jgi:hypothetical protein